MAEADSPTTRPFTPKQHSRKSLDEIATAHPIDKNPYHCIRFSRFDHNGTPLYRVTKEEGETGAYQALQRAFARHGGHCFHCDRWIEAQPMSHEVNRDHIQPRSSGGSDYLHNLVLAHGDCNRAKGSKDLAQFSVERGDKYLKLLDQHVIKIIESLRKQVA
jgi:5-methylcytosine-specific restriction endonuclease McrA